MPWSEIEVRLPFLAPFDGAGLVAFLGRRAVPGVEAVADGTYRRALRLPHGLGTVALAPRDDHVHARLRLEDPRDLDEAVGRLAEVARPRRGAPGDRCGARHGRPPGAPGRRRSGAARRRRGGSRRAGAARRARPQVSLTAAARLASRLTAELGTPHRLGVRHALLRLGQDASPTGALALAERWRPYRAHALQHLWAQL